MNNRMKQQDRDSKIINYLEDFKAATTSTLAVLFFPNLLSAQKRLKRLATYYSAINRDRDHISSEYYYYIDTKPKQLRHRLLLTNFHRELIQLGIEIVELKNEFTYFENIRPDGLLACVLPNGRKMVYFIETERSNKPDIVKYEKLYRSDEWKEIFSFFPPIIWITNKKVSKTELEVIHLRENLKDINKLCRD